MINTQDRSETIHKPAIFSRGFYSAPEQFHSQMLMLSVGVMTPKYKAMLMLPILFKTLKNTEKDFTQHETTHQGFGDAALLTQMTIAQYSNATLIGQIGIKFPTGSINVKDDTGSGPLLLPYIMQLGGGTFDALLGIKNEFNWDPWMLALSVNTDTAIGRNKHHYSYGSRWYFQSLLQYQFSKQLSFNTHLDFDIWPNIQGQDDRYLDLLWISPTYIADYWGGKCLTGWIGLQYRPTQLHNMFSISAGIPLYQYYNGIHLKQSAMIGGAFTQFF